MKRREFTTMMLGAGVLAALPAGVTMVPFVEPKVVVPGALSIASIYQLSFLPALNAMRRGQPFISSELNHMVKRGQIVIRPLGLCVDFVQRDGSSVRDQAEQLSGWTVWSLSDETKNPTQDQRVELVASLLHNTFDSHDEQLLEHIGAGRAVVSEVYRYGRGAVMEIAGSEPLGFAVKTYTCLAVEHVQDRPVGYKVQSPAPTKL